MSSKLLISALGASFVFAAAASASTVVWDQGFETNTAGWSSGGDYGVITRVASGHNGIASSSGGFHAVVEETNAGPYSFFDGSRSIWPAGGMRAAIDVYLDTSMGAGSGFDYSVAANGSDGLHQRDFIFHVGVGNDGNLRVGGSNNSNFATRMDLHTINNYLVAASGWYTFEHVFRDFGDGTLAVDLNLRDDLGNLLFTETRNTPADVLGTEVGGNRYGWFTHISVGGGVAVDNHLLELNAIPLPTPIGLAGFGLIGVSAHRRRRAC